MIEQQNNYLFEAKLALEMKRFAGAKDILGRVVKDKLGPSLQVEYLYLLGQTELGLNKFEPAQALLLEALALLDDNPLADPLRIEKVRYSYARTFYNQHHFREALEILKRGRENLIAHQIADQPFKFLVFTTLANCHVGVKEYNFALKNFKEALQLANVGEDDFVRASAYWGMGNAYVQTGKLSSGANCYMRSAGILERIGYKSNAARARGMASEVQADRKLFDLSLKTLQEAFLLVPPDDFLTLSLLYLNQAYTYLAMEQFAKAAESNEISIEYARKVKDYLLLGQGLTQIGRIYWAMQDGDRALVAIKESIEVLKLTQEKIALNKAYTRYAEIAREMGRFDEAFEAMEAGYNV